MNKHVGLIILSITLCTSVTAQVNMFAGRDLENQTQILNELKRDADFKKQNSMKGSRMSFYLDDWQAGMTYLEDDDVLSGRLYRYNIYTDQIEYRDILDPRDVEIISIGSRKFIYTNYIEESIESDGYFEVLALGDCKLLLRRKLLFDTGSKYVEAYGTDDSFNVSTSYYIKKGDAPAFEIEKDKNDLIEALYDKRDIIKYIKKKTKLFMNEKKMIDIVNHYNEI